MHFFCQRRVTFIVIADGNECWNPDGTQLPGIFDAGEISVDDELAVRPPHFAIKVPSRVAHCGGIKIGIRSFLIKVRKVTFRPRRYHVSGGITVSLEVLTLTEEA